MNDTFHLDRPMYTPREFAVLYSRYVRRVSYPTVLEWIETYDVTNGAEGVKANKSPRGRYLITAEEVGRVLMAAGAKKREEEDTSV